MHDLPPLGRLPLIPERILREHQVNEPTDNRFRASARFLQALWREDRELPIGTHIAADGTWRKLGSRISEAAGELGANFLSPAVAHLVCREVIYRESGALIDERRLWTNLLSSMPLCFNLLGPLRLDLSLASRVLALMAADLAGAEVRAVWFETSPGRGSPTLTGDATAFDAMVVYETAAGRRGFVAIEVKYSEAGWEPAPVLRPRYDDIAQASGLFIDASARALRTNPLQQFFRQMCLGQAMLTRGDYDEGRLIVVAPRLNHLIQNVIGSFRCQLVEPAPGKVTFSAVTLEHVIEAMAAAGEQAYARALFRRYCDFLLVDGEIELALAEARAAQFNNHDLKLTPPLKLIAGGRS